MSIYNKVKFFLVVFITFFAISQAEAVSIIVCEGVPYGDYKVMVEDGLRLGNVQLLKTAWSHYEDAVKFDEKDEQIESSYLELGKIYFYLSLFGKATQDDFLTAEKYIKENVDVFPDDSDAHRALGLIFVGHGTFVEASQEFELALKLNPANSLILCDMAALHLALHQPDESLKCLNRIKSLSGWDQILLAMTYSQKNMNGKALIALSRAEKLGFTGYWVKAMKEVIYKKLNYNIEK